MYSQCHVHILKVLYKKVLIVLFIEIVDITFMTLKTFCLSIKIFNIIYDYYSLGPLVCKVKEYQVEWIVDTLCTNMASDKEQLRDISSIGMFI